MMYTLQSTKEFVTLQVYQSGKFTLKMSIYCSPIEIHANNSDRLASAVHYKLATDRLEQMAEQKAVKEKHKIRLKKDWCGTYSYPESCSSTARYFWKFSKSSRGCGLAF